MAFNTDCRIVCLAVLAAATMVWLGCQPEPTKKPPVLEDFFDRLYGYGGSTHMYYSFSVKDEVAPEEVARAIAAYLQNDAHAIQSRMPYGIKSRSYWAMILAGMRGWPLGTNQPRNFDEAQIKALLHAITESPEQYPARSEGEVEGHW